MSDVELKIGAVDDGFTRLLRSLQAELRRLGADARAITRDQVKDAKEAANAAIESQRKQTQALRDTISAGKEQIAQERQAARESADAARDRLTQARDNAKAVADTTRAQVQAAREQGAATRAAAQETLAAAKQQRDAQVSAATQLLRAAQENARTQRQAGLEGIQNARSQGESIRAEAKRNLEAQKQSAGEQRTQGKALVQQTRDQVRAEVEAARDIVRANVQRTRELREQFRQQIADAKAAVIAKRKALDDVTAAGGVTSVPQAQLQGARDRLTAVRDASTSVLGGSRDQTAQARESVEAIKAAGREKIAAAQAVVRAVGEEAQANIRAAAAAVAGAREAASAKLSAARASAAAANEEAAQEVKAARALVQEQLNAGKIGVDQARQQLVLAEKSAQAKIDGSKRAQAAAEKEADAEVSAARRALQAAVTSGTGRVRAAEQAAAAAKKEQTSLLDNARLLSEEAKARLASARASVQASGAGGLFTRSMQSQHDVAGQLISRLKLLAVQYGAVRSISAFIKEGLAFDQTIETATLGIGALITAEATLTTAQGRRLQGTEALDVAMKISEEQMQKLRIAGLQTAATTEELVKAMQQAVGPGLAAGGSIDQIRHFTIQITQAAGAIGLPFHQLNEEVRSLLAGTINYNTRIAKSLGITNAMVREWKNQGTLFDELNKRFAAFNTAGERSLQTFQTLRSNITEAIQVFAGAATKPFFESLRVEGFKALNEIFNFDTGKIRDKFTGIVQTLQSVFAAAGNESADLIRGFLKGAEELSGWFERNRIAVQGVVDALDGIVRAIGKGLAAIGEYVLGIIKAGVETRALEKILREVESILTFIADHMTFILNTMVAMKALNLAAAFGALGPLGQTLVVIGAGMAALDLLIPDVQKKFRDLANEIDNLNDKIRESATETAKLGLEFIDLDKQSRNPKLSKDALTEIRKQQLVLLKEMQKLNPGIAAGLSAEKLGTDQLTEAVLKLVRAREDALLVTRTQLRLDLENERARLQALDKEIERSSFSSTLREKKIGEYNQEVEAFKRTRDELAKTDVALSDIEGTRAAHSTLVKPNAAEVDPDKGASKHDSAINRLANASISTIKEQFKAFEAAQDKALDEGRLSYKQYYDGLVRLSEDSFEAQKQVREKELKATILPQNREVIRQQLKQIDADSQAAFDKISKDRLDKERALQVELAQLRTRAFADENNTAEARLEELKQEFSKRRAILLAQHTEAADEGVTFIDRIINIEYAKARLNDLNAVIAEGSQKAATISDKVDFLHSQGAISAEEQNKILAASYEQQIQLLRAIIPEMRLYALMASDERAVEAVRKMEVELAKLEVQQREVANLSVALGHAARRGIEEGLTGLFTELFKEGRTIKTALAELALSVLQAMNQVLAPQIAQTLTAALNSAFSDLGESSAGHFVESFASVIGSGLKRVFDALLAPIFSAIGSGLSSVLGPLFGSRGGAPTASPRALDPIQTFDLAQGVAKDAAATAPEQAAAIQQQAAAATQVSAAAAMAGAVTAFAAAVASLGASGAFKGFLGGIGGGGGGSIDLGDDIGFAEGGMIGGTSPHSRADDKLVRITSREFVQPVPSVSYYGVNAMEAIRRRLIPREVLQGAMGGVRMPSLSRSYRGAHLAEGGMVTSSASGGHSVVGGHQRIELFVRSNDSHIVKVMKSKPGVSVQLDNMRKNPTATRRVLAR